MARPKKEAAPIEAETEKPAIEAQEEPKAEIIAEPEAGSQKKETKSATEGLEELGRRLEEEKNARLKAERERNEAVQRAFRAQAEKDESDRLLIEGQLNQSQSNAGFLENAYAAAITEGDTLRAAKIMREMAKVEAQILQLKNGEQSLKERPKEQPRALDPVEAFAAQLSPRSAAWVRAHPEFATNQKLTRKMIRAHEDAVDDGLPPDTDDYFAYVENRLGVAQRAAPSRIREPERDDYEEPLSEAGRGSGGRQVAPAAIPVSRDMSPSGQRRTTYRLTTAQQEAAANSGMTHQEYANQLHRIEEERRAAERLN